MAIAFLLSKKSIKQMKKSMRKLIITTLMALTIVSCQRESSKAENDEKVKVLYQNVGKVRCTVFYGHWICLVKE